MKQLARGFGANEMVEQDFPPRRLMGTLKRLLKALTPCYGNSLAFEEKMRENHPIPETAPVVSRERANRRGCAHPIQHLQCDENGYSTSRYICTTCGKPVGPPLYAYMPKPYRVGVL